MKRLRLLAIATVLMTALAVAPASAATGKRNDVWVGQVVAHRHHYDYRGSACPADAEMCIKVLANFRIVPLTRQAAAGLRKVSDGNGNARLVGYKRQGNKNHNGTLYVRRVERATPDPTT
jgi:hypothetical protein